MIHHATTIVPSLVKIPINSRPLAPYAAFGQKTYEEVIALAKSLSSLRVVHINSTEKGGGVAELLKSQIALEQGLGLASSWAVIRAPEDFFLITKKIHNLLQGKEGELSRHESATYTAVSTQLATALSAYLHRQPADLLVVHDPQPLLAAAAIPVPKISRLHIDLCQPNQSAMHWLCRHIARYDQVIVSRQDCVAPCLAEHDLTAILPAIDPLSAKNDHLPLATAQRVLRQYGVDTGRPLISQISRFDIWKDPLGVIAAYQMAKQHLPSLQLVLVGFFQADDDPEAKEYFQTVKARAGDDPDIHLFFDLKQLGTMANDDFINAVQVGSDVIIQKSIREGFGLTVTEAMWKEKAVIGGDAGGIRLQIESGKNGVLVHTTTETAAAIVQLMRSTDLRNRMGAAAHTFVRENFLVPRFLRDNLAVYYRLLSQHPGKTNVGGA